MNPISRATIEEDRGLTSGNESLHPVSPASGETFRLQHRVQGQPVDRVKGFAKAKLKDDRRSFTLVTRLDDIGRIDKVFRDTLTLDEPSLVRVNEVRDERLEARGERFGYKFSGSVLKGDRPEILCMASTNFF